MTDGPHVEEASDPVRRHAGVVWLVPAAAFLLALLATVAADPDHPARPVVTSVGSPAPPHARSADAPKPRLADVAELPAPLAARERAPSQVVLALRPGRRAVSPVPSPAPDVPPASAPSPRAPAPEPVAPRPVTRPAPPAVTPAPEFDDSGSGPAFDEVGVTP